jgi:hypothetical protein
LKPNKNRVVKKRENKEENLMTCWRSDHNSNNNNNMDEDMMMMESLTFITSTAANSWQRGLNAYRITTTTTGNTSRCLMVFLLLSVRYPAEPIS